MHQMYNIYGASQKNIDERKGKVEIKSSPRKLICQCCGMPLDDSSISKEVDSTFNEEYCKWCYADGNFAYTNIDDLINFCAEHMSNENWSPEQVRAYMKEMLPKLNYWKQLNK